MCIGLYNSGAIPSAYPLRGLPIDFCLFLEPFTTSCHFSLSTLYSYWNAQTDIFQSYIGHVVSAFALPYSRTFCALPTLNTVLVVEG